MRKEASAALLESRRGCAAPGYVGRIIRAPMAPRVYPAGIVLAGAVAVGLRVQKIVNGAVEGLWIVIMCTVENRADKLHPPLLLPIVGIAQRQSEDVRARRDIRKSLEF